MSRLRIIGIGNDDRGDDAAALRAVERLRAYESSSTAVQPHVGDGASLIQLWEPGDRVVLIDAVVSGAPAGRIHRLNLLESPVPADVAPLSTHAFGVREGIELARALRILPASLLFIGIEGHDFSPGHSLSAPVAAAVEVIVQELVDGELGVRDRGCPPNRPTNPNSGN
jgi:hydrogenase maturation protease